MVLTIQFVSTGLAREIMDISKRSIRATRYMLIGRGTSAAILFLISIITARYLGPESFGELSLAITIIVFLSVIADAGLNRSSQVHISRYLREEPRIVPATFRRILSIKVVFALLAFLLVYFLAPWIARVYGNPVLEPLCRAGGVLLAALIIFEFQTSVIQGYESFRSLCAAMVLDSGFRLIATIAIITLGFGVVGVMTGYASAALIVAAILTVFTWMYIVKTQPVVVRGVSDHISEILHYSPPILLSTLFFIAYTKFDILVLGYFGVASDVGYYSLAVGLIDNLIIPLAAIEIAIMPIVASVFGKATQKAEMSRLFNQALTMGFLFMMPVIAGVAVVANLFVVTVYGTAYESTALILIVLLPFLFTKTLGVSNGPYLIAAREARRFMWYMFGAVLVNISLLFLFIPFWGIFGAALAKIITNAFLTIIMLIYIIKRFEIELEKQMLMKSAKIISAAVLMGLICYGILAFSRDGFEALVITILSGLIIYISLIHISGVFSFREMVEFAQGKIGLELKT